MAWRRQKIIVAGGFAFAGVPTMVAGAALHEPNSWSIAVGIVLAVLGMVLVVSTVVTLLVILSSDQRSQNLARQLAIIRDRDNIAAALAVPTEPETRPMAKAHLVRQVGDDTVSASPDDEG